MCPDDGTDDGTALIPDVGTEDGCSSAPLSAKMSAVNGSIQNLVSIVGLLFRTKVSTLVGPDVRTEVAADDGSDDGTAAITEVSAGVDCSPAPLSVKMSTLNGSIHHLVRIVGQLFRIKVGKLVGPALSTVVAPGGDSDDGAADATDVGPQSVRSLSPMLMSA